MTRALIVVDVQNDFCEGGSLPVEGGAATAAKITEYLRSHGGLYSTVVASKDFHNPHDDNSGHFAADDPDYKSTWPVHCVARSEGAEYHSNLDDTLLDIVVLKGQGVPAYSAFEGVTALSHLSLQDYLDQKGIILVDVVGIATDYCVQATALDAARLGYTTAVLLDLTAAVRGPAGKADATEALMAEGVWVMTTDQRIAEHNADA